MSDADALTTGFASRHPDAFARVLGRARSDEILVALGSLPDDLRARVVSRLPGPRLLEIIDVDAQVSVDWLKSASHDDAIAMLSRLPRERRLALVNALSDRSRKLRLLRQLRYPAHCVGSLVDDILQRVYVGTEASKALADLRASGTEEAWRIVAVDDNGRFAGSVDLWRLLASEKVSGTIAGYTLTISPILPETPIASAALRDEWLRYNWLPVVDHRGHVLGGVSRAHLLHAARGHASDRSDTGDFFALMLGDMAHVLGKLMENILSRRDTA